MTLLKYKINNRMGAWSKFPDGNDYNTDLFSYFITRYFCFLEGGSYMEDDDSTYDLGLSHRLELRCGVSSNIFLKMIKKKNPWIFI